MWIKTWWKNLEWHNREFLKGMGVILTLIAIILIVGLAIITNNHNFRINAPCEEFAAYSAHELPARCLSYFGIEEVR